MNNIWKALSIKALCVLKLFKIFIYITQFEFYLLFFVFLIKYEKFGPRINIATALDIIALFQCRAWALFRFNLLDF